MPSSFLRNPLTWLAYLMLAMYGFFLNILGPITPFLKDEFKLSYTVSSLHFTAFAVGILTVGLAGHLVIQRIGRWIALWLGALGISLGAFLLIIGRTPLITISACFLMGCVGSFILAIVPAMLSDLHGALRAVAFSEANVVASLLSTAAPLMVGLFTRFSGGWRLALGLAALAPIILYPVFHKAALTSTPASNQAHASQNRSLPLLFWIYWVAVVLAVSVEFCMVFWSADYLENALAIQKADAAQAVSLFLGGMILGRLVGSRLVQRWDTTKVVSGSILLAGLGFLFFWQGGEAWLGLSGLFITGLGVASLYPLILSLTIGAAQGNTVQASARVTLASGTAILALPLLLGRLADAVGIATAYGLVAVLMAMILVIILITGRSQKTGNPPHEI